MSEAIANKARQLCRHELFRFNAYLENYGIGNTIVGGWAVYAYNPYLESIDIDVVVPHNRISDVIVIVTEQCRWIPTTIQIETFKRFSKPIPGEDDNIYLDLFSTNFTNVFHEDNGKMLPLYICLQNGYYVRKSINGDISVNAPKKELLFLYKLKAFRDRIFDIRNKATSEEKFRLEAKAIKDLSDTIALMDPNYGPLDLKSLQGMVVKHNLQFLATTIEELPLQTEAIERYRKTSKTEVQNWVKKILDAFR